MKRYRLFSIVAAVLVTFVVAGTALASGPNFGDRDGVRNVTSAGEALGQRVAHGFVDEDGDGVNDRYLSEHEFVDEDGDGVCDLNDGSHTPMESFSFAYGRDFGYRYGDGLNNQSGDGQDYRYNYADGTRMMGLGAQEGTCAIQ